MKKIIHIITAVLFVMSYSSADFPEYRRAQSGQFSSHRRNAEQMLENEKREFVEFTALSLAEYKRWKRERDLEYSRFQKELKALWGEITPQSAYRWIYYGSDLLSRGIVDFEKGRVTISVMNEDSSALCKKIKKALTDLLITTEPSSENLSGNTDRVMVPSLLSQVVENSDQFDKRGVDQLAEELADSLLVVEKKEPRSTPRAHITFDLLPDHVRRRAEPFKELILEYSTRFSIDPSLVFATIHAESYFNPFAMSSKNAVGVMQIVPEQGGRDAYRFVYGEDKIPMVSYLTDPRNNIELGCAYIYLLKNRHFRAVRDSGSKRYCAIAGYNTGSGNVAYAFTGTYTLGPAVARINRMESDDVFSFMVSNLPYLETRKYLQRITELMDTYRLEGEL